MATQTNLQLNGWKFVKRICTTLHCSKLKKYSDGGKVGSQLKQNDRFKPKLLRHNKLATGKGELKWAAKDRISGISLQRQK